jgi:HrpA-like RNA helicase
VGPGRVFRLYTKQLFDMWQDFESAEIHRKPLHENILSLKTIFQLTGDYHGVIPIFMELLESPDISLIDDSFRFLFEGK